MRFLILLCFLGICVNSIAQCNLVNSSYELTDDDNSGADTTNISLLVTGATNNNLSVSGQGLCGVKLKFKHPFMKELFIELVSPAGQKITLVGGDIVATNTPFITWDVTFIKCSAAANPDIGFLPKWENNQNWEILKTYKGQYHPFRGCLEEFNVGTVNGTWTLRCIDFEDGGNGTLLGAELIFCQNNGIICGECNLDPGLINNNDLLSCQGDSILFFDINKTFSQGSPNNSLFDYNNVIFYENKILSFQQKIDLSTQSPGLYTICSAQWPSVSSLNIPKIGSEYSPQSLQNYFFASGLCASVSDDCMKVQIEPPNIPKTRSVTICKGSTYNYLGKSYNSPGKYDIVINNEPCDSLIRLDIKVIDLKAIITTSKDSLDCTGSAITLKGSTLGSSNQSVIYKWLDSDRNIISEGALDSIKVSQVGNYTLITTISGADYTCVDSIQKSINKDNSFIITNLKSDTITCNKNLAQIRLTSNKPAIDKKWSSKNGNIITPNLEGAMVSVSGLYFVSVIGTNGCVTEDSIFVHENLTKPVTTFNADTLTCIKDSIEIKSMSIGSEMDYTYLWSGVNPQFTNKSNPIIKSAGTYQVKVANIKNGCENSFSVMVLEDKNKPTISISSDTINCTNQSVNPTITSNQNINGYLWKGNNFLSTSQNPQIRDAGNYTVEITAAKNGCKNIGAFNLVKDDAVPNVQISAAPLSCITDSSKISVVTNKSLIFVTWTGPNNFQSSILEPYVFNTGQYTISYTASNGCSGTKTIAVSDSPEIPRIIFSVDSIKCGLDTIQVKQDKTPTNYLYTWEGSGIVNKSVAQPKIYSSGKYAVTITDSNSGCFSKQEINVVDDRIYSTPDFIYNTLSCMRDSVQIILKNEDIKSVSYTGPGFTSSLKSPFVNKEGIYFYSLINNKNCVTNGSLDIVRNDTLPIIKSSYSPLMCFQDSTILKASSTIVNTQFTWKGPNGFSKSGFEVYAYKGGDYTLEGVALNGCKSSITFSLGYDTLSPSLAILTPDTITCAKPTIELLATSGQSTSTFNWFSQNTIGPKISISTPGMYIVEVKAVNQCRTIDSVLVVENKVFPVIEASATVINCKDLLSSVVIKPNTNGHTIIWANNTNPVSIPNGSFIFNTSFDGTFKFKVTNKESCTSDSEIVITKDVMPPKIVSMISDTIDCNNPNVKVGVVLDKSAKEFLWNGPGIIDLKSDSFLMIDKEGKYFLQIRGTNNCVTNTEFNIAKVVTPPVFNTYTGTLTCDQAKINIGVNPISNVVGYQWIGPDNFESIQKEPKVFAPGLYKVTVTGSSGCTSAKELIVTQDIIKPQIFIAEEFLLPCDTSAIILKVMSDKPIEKFKWIFPSGDINNDPSPITKTVGNYTVQITAINGCTSINKPFSVSKDSRPPTFNFTNDTIACNDKFAILSAKSTDPTVIFEWKDSNGIRTSGINYMTDKPGNYTLTATNSNGCKDSVILVVLKDTIGPEILINTLGTLQCTSRSVILDAFGSSFGRPYQTSWSSPSNNPFTSISDYSIMVNSVGTYSFTIQNVLNGCVTTKQISINETPQKFTKFEIDNVPPLCNEVKNGIIRLAAFNGTAPYKISFNGVDKGSQMEFFNLSPGKYSISISDSLGCVLGQEITIADGIDLTLGIDKEITIKFGDSILLQPSFKEDPSGLASLLWLRRDSIVCEDCKELLVRPFINTIYNLEYSIDGFCKKTASILIRVNNDIDKAIPNIFAPNSENQNQVFYIPQTRGIDKVNYIKIFDRWAENVYSVYNILPGDIGAGWDGNFNGKQVQSGVFIIIAEFLLSNGTVWKYQGDLTLIR